MLSAALGPSRALAVRRGLPRALAPLPRVMCRLQRSPRAVSRLSPPPRAVGHLEPLVARCEMPTTFAAHLPGVSGYPVTDECWVLVSKPGQQRQSSAGGAQEGFSRCYPWAGTVVKLPVGNVCPCAVTGGAPTSNRRDRCDKRDPLMDQ